MTTKIAAVRIKLSPRAPDYCVITFAVDENYSMAAVRAFLAANAHIYGPRATAAEILRWGNHQRFMRWLGERVRKGARFHSWTVGPFKLAPRS